MATVSEIENRLAEIDAQRQELETFKIQAAERERQQRLDELAALDEQATAYRTEAAKATDDAEKKRLYQYADESELAAVELRKELGLAEPDDAERVRLEQSKRRESTLTRPILALLKRAFLAYVAFMLGDYFAGILEVGFISFALKSIAQLAYLGGSVCFAFWLTGGVLRPLFYRYATDTLVNDWMQAGPVIRLLVLSLLTVATLLLIGFALPNPN